MKLVQSLGRAAVVSLAFSLLLTLVSVGSRGEYGYIFGLLAIPFVALMSGLVIRSHLLGATLPLGLVCTAALAYIPRLAACHYGATNCGDEEAAIIAAMSVVDVLIFFPVGVWVGKILAGTTAAR